MPKSETRIRLAEITELYHRGFPLVSVVFTWTSISYFSSLILWNCVKQCLFVLFSVAVCTAAYMSDLMQWRNGASRNDKSDFQEHPTLLSSSFPNDKP